MSYFDSSFNKFFKSLAKNNHKEWFDKNKSVYEQSVKQPFEKLVADIIIQMQKLHPGFQCEVKEAIFRLNRDIRFSTDKTPYKTYVSAAIVHGGRKNMTEPGLYIQIGANELGLFGGVYQPDKEQLSAIRTAINMYPAEVKKLKTDKKFVELFGALRGDVNKVLPAEFKEAVKTEPLIAHKQFYFAAEYKDESLIQRNDLVPFIMKHYKTGLPWSVFLSNALKG